MKKAFPMLAVLLVLVGVVIFTKRRAGGAERFPASRAAELAPAATLAFVHLPDLERTGVRWEKSDLRAIAQEPEWQSEKGQSFLRGWRENATAQAPDLKLLFRLLPELRKLEAAGLFLAVTDFEDEPIPKLVGGLPYRGKRTEVDGAVRAMKDALFARWPGATSALSSHQGIEIETITCATAELPEPELQFIYRMPPGLDHSPLWPWRSGTQLEGPPKQWTGPHPAVHLAYRDDWFFFSTDRALLVGTLDRYLRKAEAGQSLADNPSFLECRKHGVADADLVVWESQLAARRNWMHERSALRQMWIGQTVELGALLYSWRLDGPVRSRRYVYLPKAAMPEATPIAAASLTLAPPRMRSYGVMRFPELFGDVPRGYFFLRDRGPMELLQRLNKWEKPWEVFAPEVTFVLLPTDYGEWPNYVMALRVRDEAQARKFADELALRSLAPAAPREGETMRWELPPPEKSSQKPSGNDKAYPAMVILTKTHLLWGPSRSGVIDLAWWAGRAAPRNEENADFTSAVGKGELPNGAFIYTDPASVVRDGGFSLPRIVRRYAETAGTENLRNAVARHLEPGTMCVRTEGPGWVVESTTGIVGDYLIELLLVESGGW